MTEEYFDWPPHLLMNNVIKKHHTRIRVLLTEIKIQFREFTTICNHFESHEAESFFLKFTWKLEAHLSKEAIAVLPFVTRYTKELQKHSNARRPGLYSACPSIHKMYLEHKAEKLLFGQLFEQVYNIPVEKKDRLVFEKLNGKLTELRNQWEEQVQLENDILFPKIIEMEAILNTYNL